MHFSQAIKLQTQTQDNVEIPPEHTANPEQTLTGRVATHLQKAGYNVEPEIINDVMVATKVTEDSQIPGCSNDCVPPQYDPNVLEKQGFNAEMIQVYSDIVNEVNGEPPTLTSTRFDIDETGMLVETSSRKPLLPVSVISTNDASNPLRTVNTRGLKPGEAWKVIGVNNPLVWTRKKGGRYIPWPTFGQYGKASIGLAEIYNLYVGRVNFRSYFYPCNTFSCLVYSCNSERDFNII